MKAVLKTHHRIIPDGVEGIVLHQNAQRMSVEFDLTGLDIPALQGAFINPDNGIRVIVTREPKAFREIQDLAS